MSSTEDRLRAAVRAHTDDVQPDELGSLDRIRAKTAVARRRRRTAVTVAAVAAAVVAIAAISPLFRDQSLGVGTVGDDQPGTTVTTPGTVASTTDQTGSTATSTPTTTPTLVGISPADALWPAPGGGFADAETAAVRFADDFVGVTDPVGIATEEDSLGAATVTIGTTNASGSTVERSVVSVALADDGSYYVLGAQSAMIEVDSPSAGGAIASPVTVSGRAQGFEGNVVVQVREGDATIGQDHGTGGGDAMLPFTTSVGFSSPSGAKGALVLFTDSGLDGSALDFTVIPVTFGSTAATTSFDVFFSQGETVVAVRRTVPKTVGVLRAAIESLQAGPTAGEQAAGYTSWFSSETASLPVGVTISSGTAVVDFDPSLPTIIPNASTSAGSTQLLAQLDATVFQFPTVTAVEYRLGGRCDAFFQWLQMSCEVRPRP